MSMVTISAPNGGSFQAYQAIPPGGRGPGVLVMQEIFGVNAVMRGVADWYADHGFVALCPDLFWRQAPGIELSDKSDADRQRASQLLKGLDQTMAVEDCAATLDFLRRHPACTGKVGGVGFCLGGRLAYLLAARHDVDCCIGYYGVAIEQLLEEAKQIRTPFALHIAGKDRICSKEAQAALHQALDRHPLVRLYDYPEQNHAFARVGGEHYNAAAAELADLRTLELFARHLMAG